MEGRGWAEGSLGEEAKVRTQCRVALPPNLVRVNEAAKRDRKVRFTALMHHVNAAASLSLLCGSSRVTFGTNRMRESRTSGSVRVKPNG